MSNARCYAWCRCLCHAHDATELALADLATGTPAPLTYEPMARVPRADWLERELLGACLLVPEALEQVWFMLTPEDFIVAEHRAIWAELLDQRRYGVADLFSIADALPEHDALVGACTANFIEDDADRHALLVRVAIIKKAAVERAALARTGVPSEPWVEGRE